MRGSQSEHRVARFEQFFALREGFAGEAEYIEYIVHSQAGGESISHGTFFICHVTSIFLDFRFIGLG
jgi:hypothetical protein